MKVPATETDGSLYAARQKIYPREVSGRYNRWRVVAAYGLLGLFYALPWLQWRGHPGGKDGPFAVKIEVTVPGGAINVNSAHAPHPEHADVYVALRDAFDAVTRQLQDAPVH